MEPVRIKRRNQSTRTWVVAMSSDGSQAERQIITLAIAAVRFRAFNRALPPHAALQRDRENVMHRHRMRSWHHPSSHGMMVLHLIIYIVPVDEIFLLRLHQEPACQ